MRPSLPDLLQIFAGAYAVFGALGALIFPARSKRELRDRVAVASALGAVAGTLSAFAAWCTLVATGS